MLSSDVKKYLYPVNKAWGKWIYVKTMFQKHSSIKRKKYKYLIKEIKGNIKLKRFVSFSS